MAADRSALLRQAGEALYGPQWQRQLARDIGQMHPGAPRDSIDDRLMRRWAAGERPLPDWVGEALRDLCVRRHGDLSAVAAALKEWMHA